MITNARKIRTNGKDSNNLRIVIRTQHLPSSCEQEAVQWVLRCLEDVRLSYVKDEFGHYPWNVVSNVVNTNEALKYELVVAIHLGQERDVSLHHKSDEDDLVVLYENPPHCNVDADIFKEILKDVPPPAFITEVGISAVSNEFMMALWKEIISEHPETHDGKGMGCMNHPMWIRMYGGEWLDVCEQSVYFGWKGYNPETLV